MAITLLDKKWHMLAL